MTIGVVQAAGDDNPFLAARAFPEHPRVKISLASVYFLLRGGRVPPDQEQAAVGALDQAPLADEPFLLAGTAALARGQTAQGQRLLEEARRRNPRLRLARVLLLDRYLRENRVQDAVKEMNSLRYLVSGVSAVLTPELARMAQDPATAPQMLPLLRAQPALHQGVLESLVASGADQRVVLNVAGPAARSGASERWKSALLARHIAQHDLAGALDLWRSFVGIRDDGAGKSLYDADFAGRPGPPPFNWDLSTGGAGVAERGAGHVLQVDYFGRDTGILASQLLMLRPGRYRIAFQASGNASGEGARIVWTLVCNPGDAKLLDLPMTGVASAPKRFSASFTVPAGGCPAQWLRLTGVSGEVESTQQASISGLAIAPEVGS